MTRHIIVAGPLLANIGLGLNLNSTDAIAYWQKRAMISDGGQLEFFFDKRQFAQMMDIAPGLREGVALIALECIMDTGAMKLWSNADSVQGLASTTGMSRVVGEAIRRANVNPPSLFAHPHSCLI